jgi:hypothetical protein
VVNPRRFGACLVAVVVLTTGCQAQFQQSTTAVAGVRSATTQLHVQTVAATTKVVLPSRKLTPGAVFPKAGKAVVCVVGYTKTVRNVPTAERKLVFARYHIPYANHAKYEVDHLISLELGGNNAITNLWPEPYAGATGARVKDKIENKLHALVCDGKLALKTAQHAIAVNWYAAYLKYRNVAAPRPTPTAAPTTAAPPSSAPTTAPTAAPTTTPARDLCGAPANPYGYNFCGGAPVTHPDSGVCAYFPCIASFWNGTGYMAECTDGKYSMSGGLQGACSRHGGELRPVDV